jgi:hypothetical protein
MTSIPWITLLAYEARARHAADRRREERAATRLASVRSRVLAELRCAIALDIEGFLDADGDRSGFGLTCQNGSSAQGFVVSCTDNRIRTRRLAIDLEAGTLTCRYDICGGGIGVADQGVLAIEIGNGGAALSLWEAGLARTFTTVDALSAFLLAPILGA